MATMEKSMLRQIRRWKLARLEREFAFAEVAACCPESETWLRLIEARLYELKDAA